MGSLRDRVERGAEAWRQAGGPALEELLRKLEAGEDAGVQSAVPAADVLACLALAALGAEGSPGPSLIQQPPARPGLRAACEDRALAGLLPGAPRSGRLALAAGLLQILDFWDASHQAAQAADDLGEGSFSAWWHGIAHRREPDAGNAGYWFARVGRHPLFTSLGRAAEPILKAHGNDRWAGRILRGEAWNPQAMIDLCTTAHPGTAQETLARQLQRLEMLMLLDATAEPLLAAL